MLLKQGEGGASNRWLEGQSVPVIIFLAAGVTSWQHKVDKHMKNHHYVYQEDDFPEFGILHVLNDDFTRY